MFLISNKHTIRVRPVCVQEQRKEETPECYSLSKYLDNAERINYNVVFKVCYVHVIITS